MEQNKTFLKRLSEGTKYLVTGVKPDTWFSPLQPMVPQAQQAEGRQFDYMTGYNLNIQPRSEEVHGFKELRLLADNCNILRTVIETRKDQVSRFNYTFKLKNSKKKLDDARMNELMTFFASPDKRNDWPTWVRALLEDLFVIDAPTLYPQMTRGGKLFALELIDGATIKKVIDQNGRTPIDDTSPAYQQILKGVAAIDYTYNELIYKPRNIRTNKIYGYSPVEQVIMTINTAIRRQVQQLSYFTEGNTPNLIFNTPPEWNPDQIKKFQIWWDEINQGGSKSNAKFVPDGVTPFNTKPEPLKNEFDDWLARIVCYSFSISPQPFIKEMNRATAETAATTSIDEGLMPILQWVKNLMNYILPIYFGYSDVEFDWLHDVEADPLTKAQIDKIYVDSGIKTVNEVRKDIGLEPIDEDKLKNSEKDVKEKPEDK